MDQMNSAVETIRAEVMAGAVEFTGRLTAKRRAEHQPKREACIDKLHALSVKFRDEFGFNAYAWLLQTVSASIFLAYPR